MHRFARIPAVILLLISFTVFIVAPYSSALTQEMGVDGLRVTVFGPDWTWQSRDVNVLIVLDNDGDEAQAGVVRLTLPTDKPDHFAYSGPSEISFELNPGETQRVAFTDITAASGVPRQTYSFDLQVEVAGNVMALDYPVTTVRGPVLPPGLWAVYVPAGLALMWCIVFWLVLRRLGAPGAWKTRPSGPAVTETR
jgi:hypothetical protein